MLEEKDYEKLKDSVFTEEKIKALDEWLAIERNPTVPVKAAELAAVFFIEKAQETAWQKGFWPEGHCDVYALTLSKIALIHSEMAEFHNAPVEQKPEELADVIIRTLDLLGWMMQRNIAMQTHQSAIERRVRQYALRAMDRSNGGFGYESSLLAPAVEAIRRDNWNEASDHLVFFLHIVAFHDETYTYRHGSIPLPSLGTVIAAKMLKNTERPPMHGKTC